MSEQLAKVAKVIDAYRVVINRGSRDDINLGDRFIVFKIGEEICDPDTNESLGNIEIIKGKGKVVHLQEKMSTLENYETERVKRHMPRGLFGASWALGYDAEYDNVQKTFNDPELGDVAKKLE